MKLVSVKSTILLWLAKAVSSLQDCHKIPNVSEDLSLSWVSSTCRLFNLLMQLVNGAQFLNITFLLEPLFGFLKLQCL